MGIDMPQSDREIEEDPFLILGYGVNAYLFMLQELARMFAVISLLAVPLFVIYALGVSGRVGAFSEDDSYLLSKFTLGNMGGSSVYCGQYRLGKREADVSCPINSIIDTQNAVYGVMSADFDHKQFCHQSKIDEVLQSDSHGHKNCSEFVDRQKVEKHLKESCEG